MADRVSASIEIGGSLSSADYSILTDLISGEGLSTEWDGEPFQTEHHMIGEPLSLYAHEVAWGHFSELEGYCIRKALPFTRWCDGYSTEWGPQRVVFTGQGAPRTYDADTNNRVVIDRATVEKLRTVDAIQAWFNDADFAIPAFVVEDASEPSVSD